MSTAKLYSPAGSCPPNPLADVASIASESLFFYLGLLKILCTHQLKGTLGVATQHPGKTPSGAPLANRSWRIYCILNRSLSLRRSSNLDRKQAIESFTRITGVIQNGAASKELPHLVDRLVLDVGVIQATNKKPACQDCRAARLCARNLAVPVRTNCESCGKRIVFIVPVEYQDAAQWGRPVSRISDLCPRARPKKDFAWCPACRQSPDRVERINKFKEKRKDDDP